MTNQDPGPVEPVQPWPVTPLVRAQLAIAAVWGPYLIGVLILLPTATLPLLFGVATLPVLDGRLVLGVATGLGALITARVMPRLWPAAHQVASVRRIEACLLGPAVTMLLGVGARQLGMIPARGSMDPAEAATILACTIGAAAVSWPFLGPSHAS
jgi:hypothetical protein